MGHCPTVGSGHRPTCETPAQQLKHQITDISQDDNTFVLYYTATLKDNPSRHCIGSATSARVIGPFTPTEAPLACPIAQGGAIDPAGFRDPADGSRYVTYKVDGNALGGGGQCGNANFAYATPIMLQRVDSKDGITAIGEPTQILDRGPYDGPLIEAPSLAWHKEGDRGVYFLFFSSNCYNGDLYDISYATATNILGPYTKTSKPLLVTGDGDGKLFSRCPHILDSPPKRR